MGILTSASIRPPSSPAYSLPFSSSSRLLILFLSISSSPRLLCFLCFFLFPISPSKAQEREFPPAIDIAEKKFVYTEPSGENCGRRTVKTGEWGLGRQWGENWGRHQVRTGKGWLMRQAEFMGRRLGKYLLSHLKKKMIKIVSSHYGVHIRRERKYSVMSYLGFYPKYLEYLGFCPKYLEHLD